MTDSASTPFKCILFEKRVRFRLPADWLEGAEAGVGVFQPPRDGGGTLRVTSEVLRHGGPPPATVIWRPRPASFCIRPLKTSSVPTTRVAATG
jgi:hypothetical protein